MNAQQLKNAILQEAIEGRLVPQDPQRWLHLSQYWASHNQRRHSEGEVTVIRK
jgi:hypothetical protein